MDNGEDDENETCGVPEPLRQLEIEYMRDRNVLAYSPLILLLVRNGREGGRFEGEGLGVRAGVIGE